MITVRFEGGRELARKLKRMDQDLRSHELDNASRKAANTMRDEAKLRAPVETGLLQRAIISRKQRRLSGSHNTAYAVGVGSKAWYFPIVEFGARPHVIRARRKRVLASTNTSAFGPVRPEVFGSRVDHPGVASKGFFRAAWESTRVRAMGVMREVLRRRIMR